MDNTAATIKALRALSALSLKKLLHPAIVMTAVLLGAGYVLMLLLVIVFSKWWLLLTVILLPLTITTVVLYVAIRYLLKKLMPRVLKKDERERLKHFTDRLVTIADKSRTPYPIMLLLIAKDVVRGKESAFLRSLIGDSRELYREFSDVRKLFER